MNERVYIIPARSGSKGFPNKNRKLFKYTIEQISKEEYANVIVSTDDQEIIKMSHKFGIDVHIRSSHNSSDTASMKEAVREIIKDKGISSADIILLYLTYPERKTTDIKNIYDYYAECEAYSLLCRHEIVDHPYLCLESVGDNRGKQVVAHNLYRRQDYPNCFRLSHYVCIFNADHLDRLNDNLYNEDTVFYRISDVVDVDTLEDYKKINF